MKTLGNSKKQEQFKKFMAKDTSFLKKIVGGENDDKIDDNKVKL